MSTKPMKDHAHTYNPHPSTSITHVKCSICDHHTTHLAIVLSLELTRKVDSLLKRAQGGPDPVRTMRALADELNRLYRQVSESATSLEWAELEQEPD